jgi:hypothetical protein
MQIRSWAEALDTVVDMFSRVGEPRTDPVFVQLRCLSEVRAAAGWGAAIHVS